MTIEETAISIAQKITEGGYLLAHDEWKEQVGTLSASQLRALKESIEKHERLLKKYG